MLFRSKMTSIISYGGIFWRFRIFCDFHCADESVTDESGADDSVKMCNCTGCLAGYRDIEIIEGHIASPLQAA